MELKANINSYGRINCKKGLLKRLQVGDINLGEKIPSRKIEVEINIDILRSFSKYKDFFNTQRTGYFQLKNELYYRNCNIVSNTQGYHVIYKGILPFSYLEVELIFNEDKYIANIKVSQNYLIESRSRLTKNSSFEEFINNLFIVLSILKNKIPLHAAGCFVSKDSEDIILFMGYPNTGKTTTSYKLSEKLNSDYFSEDITFLDVKTNRLYSCPNTSNNFKIDKFEGNLKFFVPLKRIDSNIKSLFNFIHTMNLYEFFWNQDLVIRHLFSNLNGFNLSEIEMNYINGLKYMVQNIEVIEISSNTEKWVDEIYLKLNNK